MVSQSELDTARLELLRRRVALFGVALGVLVAILTGLQTLVVLQQPGGSLRSSRIVAGLLMAAVLIVVPGYRHGRRSTRTLRSLVWRTNLLVVVAVLSQIGGANTLAQALTDVLRVFGFVGNLGPMVPLVVFLLFAHTAAAIIIPWTALEACAAPVAVAVASAALALGLSNDSALFIAMGAVLPLAAGVPGVAIAFLRAGSLRETLGLRLIGARYAEVERELSTARRIHERLFPRPVREGPIRMDYRYQPMRQIGGDYLDATVHEGGAITLTLIDVTGHGIAAALAVNRLHGELKRLFAQHADPGPGAIVAGLNNYIFLTLSDEQVFATAAVLRVGPEGSLRLAVAGHPPPMLRRGDGRVEAFDSTAPMLGLFPAEEFAGEESAATLGPGDALVLYTDGATEARGQSGRQLGTEGLARALEACAPGHDGLAAALAGRVEAFRAGPADDDVLIVSVGRG